MTQRRRALTLESVEERCVPAGGRWDHRPPPVTFADVRPNDDAPGRRLGRGDDGPSKHGRGLDRDRDTVVVVVQPPVQPPPAIVGVIRSVRAEAPEARGDRPEAIVTPTLTQIATLRQSLRTQAVLPEPRFVAGPVLVATTQIAARPSVERTFTVAAALPEQAVPAGQPQPVGPSPTANTVPPPAEPARATAPAAATTWVPMAVPAAEEPTPTTPTPEEIVLPGVAVDPPTVAVVVEAAREAVAAVAPVLVPLAGALPVDLVAVERAAADLLAGLTEAAAPESSVGRWGWVGLSVLAAGGLIHALRPTTDRRHTAAVGNDSALARWESRHARPPR